MYSKVGSHQGIIYLQMSSSVVVSVSFLLTFSLFLIVSCFSLAGLVTKHVFIVSLISFTCSLFRSLVNYVNTAFSFSLSGVGCAYAQFCTPSFVDITLLFCLIK